MISITPFNTTFNSTVIDDVYQHFCTDKQTSYYMIDKFLKESVNKATQQLFREYRTLFILTIGYIAVIGLRWLLMRYFKFKTITIPETDLIPGLIKIDKEEIDLLLWVSYLFRMIILLRILYMGFWLLF